MALGKKFKQFAFHVHFFTHGEGVKDTGNGLVYTFYLRKDKGAKNFQKEYAPKFKEIKVPVEFDDQKYEVSVAIECTKEASN